MKLQEQINRISEMMGILNEGGRLDACFNYLDREFHRAFGKMRMTRDNEGNITFRTEKTNHFIIELEKVGDEYREKETNLSLIMIIRKAMEIFGHYKYDFLVTKYFTDRFNLAD